MITRFVNLDSSGGDGTTNGTSGATAAYASLEAALDAEATDLTSEATSTVTIYGHDFTDIALYIICDKASSSGVDSSASGAAPAADVDGFTVDATHKILIRAADGTTISGETTTESRHLGVIGAGYILEVASASAGISAVDIDDGHTIFVDMEARIASGGDSSTYAWQNDVTDRSWLINCIGSNLSGGPAFRLQDFTVCVNCIALDSSLGFTKRANSTNTSQRFYNCLATSGSGIGFETSFSEGQVKNCVAVDNTGDDFDSDYAAGAFTNCASEDTTAIGTGAVTGISLANDFVDHANDDFKPEPSGALDGAGADLSADGDFAFDFDITGAARTQWDIGPFAVAAAGPSGQPFPPSLHNRVKSTIVRRI